MTLSGVEDSRVAGLILIELTEHNPILQTIDLKVRTE